MHAAQGAVFPSGLTMDFQHKISELSRFATRTPKECLVGGKTTDVKKIRGPESPLYTAICPIVYVIRVFGLAPYEFHNDELIPSSIYTIYAFVCMFLYSYVIYSVLHRFIGIEHEKPLLGHTESGKAACNYFMAVFDILMTLFTRGKFVRIWTVIQDYDEIVKNFGYPMSEKGTCIWAWIMFGINFLMWMAVHKTGMYAFGEAWIDNVAYMIIYVGSSISVIKFSGMMILLGRRFEHLNGIAKKSGPLASRWLLASPVVDSKDIEYLHNVLMMACESLNSLYSWPLLLWVANLCLHIVSDFYFVIQRTMMMSWSLTEWRTNACLTAWIVAFLGQLIFLCLACDFAASEANCMGYIMINWRRWLKMRRHESVETSIHLINRRLNFSAGGCFYVNLPLLRTIAALLTTYLVILLQFPE